MNVLVTGGSGFLGAYVVAALEKAGHTACVYDRAAPAADALAIYPELGARLRLGSIDEPERLFAVCREEGIEAIVHMAAKVGFEPSLADPLGFYQTNVMGMVNVCEAARRAGVRKLICISSNSVYHPGRTALLVETDPPFSITRANPAGHYGTSKMAAEAIGMAYAEFHEMDFIALRVSAIYGFGMRVAMHLKPMVENTIQGKPTRIATGGRMKRDYTHVLDVARAIRLAADLPRVPAGAQRVLNVAAGQVHASAEVAEVVRRVLPGADIEIGSAMTAREEENLKMRAPLDITMAKSVLNWAPRWTLEDGIRQYAEAFAAFARQG